ncbi:MAG: hypothetical protein NUV91_07160, partial [Candidatus Omnitrophica bacterium]|nr:hypothetical protein [Candidatus Omnitrophota bacterium]
MNISDRPNIYSRLISFSILFAIAWFLTLCTLHYFNLRTLWLDEYQVFRSLATFAPIDFFTKELITGQIFPRLYLFLIQRISEPFDWHVLSLRLLSYLSMTTAFLIWLKIANYELKSKEEYFAFVLSWTASIPLIYYASELKPYSMDVMTTAIFLLFIYNQKKLEEGNPKVYFGLLSALPLLGLFSYPAFLFFIFPLYNLLTTKSPLRQKALICYLISGIAAIACLYFFDLRITQATTGKQSFHDYAISFASAGEFFKTWGEGTMNLISRWFTEQPKLLKKLGLIFTPFGLIYIFYAFFSHFKREGFAFRSINTVALVIYAELFLLGALQKYPFSVPRTSLFFCPIVLLMTVKGLQLLKKIHPRIHQIFLSLYCLFLIFVTIGIGQVVF